MLTRARGSLPFLLGAVLAGCGGGGADPTITVTGLAGPLAGVDVVFHDADGDPVVAVRTDSAGVASGDIDDGGMVTVLLQDGPIRIGATFTEVERGDELTLRSPASEAPELGQALLTLPAYTGATVYRIRSGCHEMSTSIVGRPVAFDIDSLCVSSAGLVPILATAENALGEVLAVSTERDAPWANPMQVTMPGWRLPSALVLQGASAPAGASSMRADFAYVASGVRIEGASWSADLGPGEGASFTTPFATDFAQLVQTTVGVRFGDGDGESFVMHQTAAPPARRTVVLSADLLPRVPPPSYDRSVSHRPSLTWTPQAGLDDADAASAVFGWREGEGAFSLWMVLAPPDVESRIQLPALPDELAAWAPSDFAQMTGGIIAFLEADWVTSYARVREDIGPNLLFGMRRELFPAAGDAAVRLTMGNLSM